MAPIVLAWPVAAENRWRRREADLSLSNEPYNCPVFRRFLAEQVLEISDPTDDDLFEMQLSAPMVAYIEVVVSWCTVVGAWTGGGLMQHGVHTLPMVLTCIQTADCTAWLWLCNASLPHTALAAGCPPPHCRWSITCPTACGSIAPCPTGATG